MVIMNSNDSLANIPSVCHVCDGDHNVLGINLESGGYIITRPFPKERVRKVNVADVKRRAMTLDLVDVFWSSIEGEI